MTIAPDVQPGQKVTFAKAARILAERDPVIARLLEQTGPPRLSRPSGSHFGALVQAIVYQQLAGAAAAAIHGRLIAALGGDVQPEALIALSEEALRAVGLSRNKIASVRDLAANVLDGTVVLSPAACPSRATRRSSRGCRPSAASAAGRRRCSCCSSSAA
jgi:DNA-3-methyladenine glycosylase II